MKILEVINEDLRAWFGKGKKGGAGGGGWDRYNTKVKKLASVVIKSPVKVNLNVCQKLKQQN